MIFARILSLIGSVIVVFGLWKFVAPLIYADISIDIMQGVISLVIGGVMVWIGRQIEHQQGDGAGNNE